MIDGDEYSSALHATAEAIKNVMRLGADGGVINHCIYKAQLDLEEERRKDLVQREVELVMENIALALEENPLHRGGSLVKSGFLNTVRRELTKHFSEESSKYNHRR